jgi:hypothetical protein
MIEVYFWLIDFWMIKVINVVKNFNLYYYKPNKDVGMPPSLKNGLF